MEELKEIIKKIAALDKVTGVVLMDLKGKVFESAFKKEAQSKNFEKALYEHINRGKQFGELIGLNNIKSSYVEFPETITNCDILGDKGILAVIASVGANMGRIRMETGKNRKRLIELLSS
ncbi:MAG: hypothetical protein M1269_01615 [Chloroflexi bacterium]|nr:hypothetical protein [Chloroflexota bacterium]